MQGGKFHSGSIKHLRILIITSCTGEKTVSPPDQLSLLDFQQGAAHVRARERELKEFFTPAGEIYTGEQHVRLMRGLSALRTCSDLRPLDSALWILSAGYGLIPEDRKIAPYECTFATMKTRELRAWADHLQVPKEFRSTVAQPYDLTLILLGDNYLQACQLDDKVKFGGLTVLFCGQGQAKKIPRLPNVRIVTLSNAEAKRFSCGLVGLKGEVASRLLQKLAAENDALLRLKDPAFNVLSWLDEAALGASAPLRETKSGSAPSSSPREKCRANPAVDHVIQLAPSWQDKPHRQKLRYFIPEWDDLVDPDYDFLNDQHSGGSSDWSNEVYAHQMYPEPNYDGLLMSRAVAEKSKKKKERINALGVHRFLRVPREFPIMGDCGAFDYIMEEKPPYPTEDVLDYYTRLDFDYGVSVDHLIVTATEHQKKFRYDLTIHNAEEFLKEHRKAGLKWEPIGAVQGWDAESYAKAAAQYVKMGYRYIGLGGLVRTASPEILRTLRMVHEVVPKGVGIHLFGLARLKVIRQMADLGVTSVDSASALRRAWLGDDDNYWTLSGRHFRAIRIPEAGKSFRAKRMVSEGRASGDEVARKEEQCLTALRRFDKGKGSVVDVLATISEYDHLITPDRTMILEGIRETLEAKPWKTCPCSICKRDGIEVIIFRGNNRNRRRGFHNTYVFYQFLQKALNGEAVPSGGEQDRNQLELSQLVTP